MADFLEDAVFPGDKAVFGYDMKRGREGFCEGIGKLLFLRENGGATAAEPRCIRIVRMALRAFHGPVSLVCCWEKDSTGTGKNQRNQRGLRIDVFSMLDPVDVDPLRSIVDPVENAIISGPETIAVIPH
ncbi:MAG: hypothetical protein NT147_09715 [Candidatus Aminicenantes bacterium]|nr:hypothetical protein [Candidatus Aminicenantes bacterium]